MTKQSRAVFLSYASQDAEAARRICVALKAAGVEVWFDQSELRGGDVWDRQIRKQIHDCALFIPVISAHTQARTEGYFRREWKLAVDRTHDMSDRVPFLMPVVIDDTRDQDADVPDRFREVQWTHLPGEGQTRAFVERVMGLLSPGPQAPEATAGTTVVLPAHTQITHLGAVSRRRLALTLIAGVALIVIGFFAIDRLIVSKRTADTGRVSAPTVQSAAPTQNAVPEKSIAVLPFVDMSEKHDQEYFSDGLAEELLDLLAQVQDLRVPARTSSFYFKGKTDDVAVIAERLRVAHVLEGSVRKAGNTIRVTAQLIRADNGYHLWSKTYDRDVKDIFKVQDEIASAVVEALKGKLLPTPDPANSHRTANSDAYNEYLLGRQFHNRRSEEGYRGAIKAYRKAIAIDPGYGAAYAGIAMSEALLAETTRDVAGLQSAVVDAEKAVALAPNVADSYATRGFLRYYCNWDWSGAQADFTKALALDSSDSTIHVRYGGLLAAVGRLPEAIAATKRTTELDPLSAVAWQRLARYYIATQQFQAADDAVHRAIEIQPDSVAALSVAGTLQLIEGKALEALATFRENGDEVVRLSGSAMAEHSLGHAKESKQSLDELIAKHSLDAPYFIAQVHAWRADSYQAFEWLDRAYERRDSSFFNLKSDAKLASLRGDPRYRALLGKLNLPE
jgi:TolB-like protein